MNKYPLWKNLVLLAVLLIAVLYAMPNLFLKDPSIQITSSTPGAVVGQDTPQIVTNALKSLHVKYKAINVEKKSILVLFPDTDSQFRAKEILSQTLGDQYIVALDLTSDAPAWLKSIGAQQVKLGLDLRGGVHLLLQIDIDSVIKRRLKGDIKNISEELRHKHVRYSGIAPERKTGGIMIRLRNADDVSQAISLLSSRFPEFLWKPVIGRDSFQAYGKLIPQSLQKIGQYAVDQTITTLNRRVNELGVSEAIVQQQGQDRVSVDLPGIQDAAQAKNILGKTATLEFHMVDTEHDASSAVGGLVPPGDELYNHNGRSVLLKSQIVLSGDSITSATAGFDTQSARPMVGINLGGGGESLFERITAENIGKPMATVYTEIKSKTTMVNGKPKITYKKESKIINIATIQSALGNSFQITGLSSPQTAQNLALLLRAGSLPAAITIIEEKTVGPSMGKQNIHQGMMSVSIGLFLVVIFMLFYYRFFGFVADMGLFINLIFLMAVLSVIGATLTFAGIAGIVLTIGMAVDANVLIYERIREELRWGMTPQAAIHAGYERAFVTIVDANVTTLIVAMILFALGTGEVKGFAITLTIGLLTSMFSAITYTRMIVNWKYGGKKIKWLSIGIKPHEQGTLKK